MTVRLYKSTQQGAPSLTGQVGSLVALCLAALVNGYGSVSTTSITRSGTTATLTASSAHGLSTGDVVTVAGANETDYNGNFIVTVTSTTVFTYTVANSPATPATGTITSKRAGAGWTEDFTATNKGTFRNSPTTGTGFYLDVNDAAPSVANEARVRGYETMSAVGTGTGAFPTTAQMTNGLFLRKSTTADATARPWYIVADETVFYLFIETGDSPYYVSPTRTASFSFGDFYSYKANDAYRCMIMGKTTENSSSSGSEALPMLNGTTTTGLNTSLTGHYVARGVTGTGGAIAVGKHTDQFKLYSGSSSYAIGNTSYNNFSYPNAADNGLYMAPLYVHHNSGVRGYLKGLWAPLQENPLGHTDVFSGTGSLSAKSFLTIALGSNNNANPSGQVFLETSNTWS